MANFSENHISMGNQGVVIGQLMSTPASNAVNVHIHGVTVSARVIAGLTGLASGDRVILIKHGQTWFVFGEVAAGPAVPPAFDASVPLPPASSQLPPAPKPTVRYGSLLISPPQTATYRDGKWRTDVDGGVSAGDVLQGVYPGYGNNVGCAFYGTKPRSLAGATVTRAVIRARRIRAGQFAAQTATLWLVTQSSRPGGAPTRTSSTSGPRLAVDREDNSFDIPTSWAQAMVDGTAGGLAVYSSTGSPYMRFAGRASWAPAWTMTIYWRK